VQSASVCAMNVNSYGSGLIMGMFYLWLTLGITVFVLLVIYALFINRGTKWNKFWLNVIDGLIRYFVRYYHRAKLQSIPLPKQGAVLVVSNHISGLDPLLLIAASPRPLRFIIAHEQYDRLYLKWLFRYANAIRVNRHLHPERAVRSALKALKKGEVVVVFPHGKIILDSEPAQKIKHGVIKLSEWTGAPIYPCRIDGVKGQGEIMQALVKRGQPRLMVAAPVICRKETEQSCEEYLLRIMQNRSYNMD